MGHDRSFIDDASYFIDWSSDGAFRVPAGCHSCNVVEKCDLAILICGDHGVANGVQNRGESALLTTQFPLQFADHANNDRQETPEDPKESDPDSIFAFSQPQSPDGRGYQKRE